MEVLPLLTSCCSLYKYLIDTKESIVTHCKLEDCQPLGLSRESTFDYILSGARKLDKLFNETILHFNLGGSLMMHGVVAIIDSLHMYAM